MDDKTLLLILADMLKGMIPHAWLSDDVAQYFVPGAGNCGRFYNVTFTSDYEIAHIEVLDVH